MAEYETKVMTPGEGQTHAPGTPENPVPALATADPRYGSPPIYYVTCSACRRTYGTHALGLDRCTCGTWIDKRETVPPKEGDNG